MPLPPYKIDGKSLKTVNGLFKHLMRKHPTATEMSAIANHRLTVYSRRGGGPESVVATYKVEYLPDAITLEVTP